MTHTEFLTAQHKAVLSCLEAVDAVKDVLELGQISRRGVAIVCHLESLAALLDHFKEGTATMVYHEEWEVSP